jgi:cysteine desulfurase family protein
MNNAATGWPKPESVLRAVNEYLSTPPVEGGRGPFGSNPSEGAVDECRERLARFFGAPDKSRVVFTSGGTHSLNLAIRGLSLKGSHIVTTMTEHNSVIRPLKHLEHDTGARVTFVKCDPNGFVDPDEIIRAIRPDTKLIAVSHCSNVTGTVQDITEVGKAARERGIVFLADASQSAGHIPIDVEAMHIDLLAFTGHKGLRGIQGIGGLVIREGVRLDPLMTGGTGVKSEDLYQPEAMPLFYESGTLNIPGIAALNEGVRTLEGGAMEADESRAAELMERLIDGLSGVKGIRLIGNTRPAILSFTLEGKDPEEIGYLLANMYGIAARTGLHCAPIIHRALGTYPHGTVRVSLSKWNTDGEIDILAEAVGKMNGD